MSKLGKLGGFLKFVGHVAPAILGQTKLAPIAPWITAAVQEAETLPGATGAQKLDHVVTVAQDAAEAVNAGAGQVLLDPAQLRGAVEAQVAAIIAAYNTVHKTS